MQVNTNANTNLFVPNNRNTEGLLEDLIDQMKGGQDAITASAAFPEDNPFGRM